MLMLLLVHFQLYMWDNLLPHQCKELVWFYLWMVMQTNQRWSMWHGQSNKQKTSIMVSSGVKMLVNDCCWFLSKNLLIQHAIGHPATILLVSNHGSWILWHRCNWFGTFWTRGVSDWHKIIFIKWKSQHSHTIVTVLNATITFLCFVILL